MATTAADRLIIAAVSGAASRQTAPPCTSTRNPGAVAPRPTGMFSLVFMLIRLTIWAAVMAAIACAFLLWLMIALPLIAVASMRGNRHSAAHWQRSLRWRVPRF